MERRASSSMHPALSMARSTDLGLSGTRPLEEKVRHLERELSKVKGERDDLAADVENLCRQSGAGMGSIFGGSSVISESLTALQKEVNALKQALGAAQGERDSLREDMISFRQTKRLTEVSYREVASKAERLEGELAFYQAQSATAMADRDKAMWEAEELRGRALSAEASAAQAQGRAEAEGAMRREAEGALSAARNRIQGLERDNRQLAEIPGLRADLKVTRDRLADLQQRFAASEAALAEAHRGLDAEGLLRREAEARGAGLDEELSVARADSAAAEEYHQGERARLEEEVGQLRRERDQLHKRAATAEGGLANTREELDTTRSRLTGELEAARKAAGEREEGLSRDSAARAAGLEAELQQARERLKSTQAQLEEALAGKAKAEERGEAAEGTAVQAFEEVGAMRDEVQDLRERLTQATKEKVAALMQAAEVERAAKRGAKAGGGQGGTPPGKQPAGSWRAGLSALGLGGQETSPAKEVFFERRGSEAAARDGSRHSDRGEASPVKPATEKANGQKA